MCCSVQQNSPAIREPDKSAGCHTIVEAHRFKTFEVTIRPKTGIDTIVHEVFPATCTAVDGNTCHSFGGIASGLTMFGSTTQAVPVGTEGDERCVRRVMI